jgi:hypothetical protein
MQAIRDRAGPRISARGKCDAGGVLVAHRCSESRKNRENRNRNPSNRKSAITALRRRRTRFLHRMYVSVAAHEHDLPACGWLRGGG